MLVAGTLSVACGPALPADALRSTETIVGRAAWNGQIVLLTDARALLVIDPVAALVSRREVVARDGTQLKPWGLAAADGALFTVSGFFDLMRIDAAGNATRAARFERPIANLLNLDDRMAAQYAAGDAGSPLAVQVGPSGRFTPLRSPPRVSFGLSSVEDEVLHLLSCSAPPRVVCWLPHRAALFEMAGTALVAGADLEGFAEADVTQVMSGRTHRLIDDVLADETGNYLVLHRAYDGAGQQALTWFDRLGRRRRTRRLEEPLRLLLAGGGRSALALSRRGVLTTVKLTW
ncbi:MAG: hypothetical protein M3Q55_06520 [Acidobacteriota bacterium]|nr:hypothetical protein [Acidobacteriota bacterium]